MTLHPSVLALNVGALLATALLVYAARWALVVLRRWDLSSGATLQLELERRTVLISTIVRLVLVFQLAALFLFVYTADSLAPLFTGAMCAAGTLAASAYGYPVLLLKIAAFLCAGLWLAVDAVDRRAPDYPLIRPKYAFLLAITPVFALEALLQLLYFADLRPEVITSCCGSLFAEAGSGVGASLSALPPRPTAVIALLVVATAIAGGVLARRHGGSAALLGVAAGVAIPVSLSTIIALVSPYVYALPTHHCPFCLLQREYRYVGYALYATTLGGGLTGMSAAIVSGASTIPSLADVVPVFQRRFATVAIAAFLLLALLSGAAIATSQLKV